MKTRIKMHQMPGDITKQEKAAILEGKHSNKDRARKFKNNYILIRERAILKRRTIKQIDSELECSNIDNLDDA